MNTRPTILLVRAAALGALAGLAGCVGAPTVVEPTGYGATCYAGAYVCQLPAQAPVGSQCTCPGIGAPSFGAVR
jgi:hypothetical protein